MHDLAMRLRNTRERLAGEHGRQPTIAELAAETGASEEQVLEALGALKANEVISLQTPSEDSDDGRTLADQIGAPDDEYGRIEQRGMLDELLKGLTVHEKRVIHLRFTEDLTQCEIGSMLGVSQMAISRLLTALLPRLT